MPRLLSLLLIGFALQTGYSQSSTDFCKQLEALKVVVENYHYTPKQVDDSLSKNVHELFIENIDPDKILFTDSDIAVFKTDELKLDDYINGGQCDFLNVYVTTLQERIAESKAAIEANRFQKLDYSGTVDSLHYHRTRESGYFDDQAAMKKYWSKRIRYELFVKMTEEDSVLSNIQQNFKQREEALRPVVFEALNCKLSELENKSGGLEKFVAETFLNAFANYQDPNTFFFNNSDKTMFENSVSVSTMTFGLYTDKNEDGEIVVSYVSPGSAAYFEGSIEEGDVIRSLQSGTTEVKTTCISNEEISAFLSDKKYPTVTFRTKKKDGSLKEVTLTKKEEKAIENLTRGYIINDSSPIGYISIPSFYTDMESPSGLGVANDVAKEVYRLKQENVEGLIIDLRFNGGGSMKEAADLSGMFIDRGPVSIIRYKNGETYTVRDSKKGTVFAKPIVIIQNSYSASASEFFASLMQDYNRAVVVGTSSYGKSSMQTILPLDRKEELGYCKITTDVFYRVTGKSNQSLGVTPDIEFPSMYTGLKITERYSAFALPNDSVEVTTKHRPKRRIPIDYLKDLSVKRRAFEPGFSKINRLNEIMIDTYVKKDTVYALTLRNVFKDLTSYNKLWKEFIDYFDERSPRLIVSNTKATEDLLQFNEDEKKINALTTKDIANDIFIEEAYHIITDINQIK